MSVAVPFTTGVKSAGGGYFPLFKKGGRIVEAQPVAVTPKSDTNYFTSTGIKISRKNFISKPAFENPNRKPADPYPQSKPSHYGNVSGGCDWVNHNATVYKETANATYNRMLVDKDEQKESIPHQWLKPEHVNYSDKTNQSLFDYQVNLSQDYLRDRVEHLRAKGYSDAEISKSIEKMRERDIAKAMNEPTNSSATLQGAIARNIDTNIAMGFTEFRGQGTPGTTQQNRTEQLIHSALATATPLRPRQLPTSAFETPRTRHVSFVPTPEATVSPQTHPRSVSLGATPGRIQREREPRVNFDRDSDVQFVTPGVMTIIKDGTVSRRMMRTAADGNLRIDMRGGDHRSVGFNRLVKSPGDKI